MKSDTELNAQLCRCGHRRDSHAILYSVNYTEGKCKECSCKHFLMPELVGKEKAAAARNFKKWREELKKKEEKRSK